MAIRTSHLFIRTCLLFFTITLFGSCIKFDIPVKKLRKEYADDDSQYVVIDGMNVHYKDQGHEKAIPIVLLHGSGASLHTWDVWADTLSYDYRVIRVDLPGYGLTGPHPRRDYSMEMYREFIDALLYELEIRKCHIVGNSLGGRIAWEYALAHPKKVRKIILIDALGYPQEGKSEAKAFKMAQGGALQRGIARWMLPKSMVKKTLETSYGDPTKVDKELVKRYYKLARRDGNRKAFIDRARHEDYDRTRRIRTIEHPVLIMWGTEDRLIPIQHASYFHRDLPNSTIKMYPDVGHVPMEEIPYETARDAMIFLEKRNK